jgi:hypothetical protein
MVSSEGRRHSQIGLLHNHGHQSVLADIWKAVVSQNADEHLQNLEHLPDENHKAIWEHGVLSRVQSGEWRSRT